MKRLLFVMAVVWMTGGAAAQTLVVAPGVRLPGDSALSLGLIGSLQGWLDQRDKPDSLNTYVSSKDLAETTLLMDELRGIDWYLRRDSVSSCQCYLGNVVALDDGQCLVQLNWVGTRKDTPSLRACCTVLAQHHEGARWVVSSPLAVNTIGWKTKTIGNCLFHYRTTLNERKARVFVDRIASYDRRLGATDAGIDFYCCDNLPEATRLIGEDYRLDYNGTEFEELSGDGGKRTVVVSGEKFADGFNSWDTHDWWHGRLHRVVPVSVINRPVDEGMAYLYGGSWRVYGWEDVLRLFREYAAAHPDADWLTLYKNGTRYVSGDKPLYIAYTINALIVRRLERQRGFAAALPLVACGTRQKGDANYFAALKSVCGVGEDGFNDYVAGLLNGNK